MILTIDIGNSYITIGGWRGDTLFFVSDRVTALRDTADQYAVELKEIMNLYGVDWNQVEGAMISSVVPELVSVIKSAVYKLSGVRALVVGPGIKSGLHIAIDNPAQLGADIAACAVAALDMGKLPCMICDMGTAMTLSVLDGSGKLVGVIIGAGVGTTLEMLTSKTALLPHVSIEAPQTVIGKNTMHSMQSGLVFGTAAMIDGLAARVERELGEDAALIATGRAAGDIAPHCDRKIQVCDHLLLKGLKIIYDKNSKGSRRDERKEV